MMKPQKTRNTFDLLADVGGTNTRLALAQDGNVLPDSVQRLKNADFDSFDSVLLTYLEGQGHVECDGAVAAIAGPVTDGAGLMTNLDWRITTECLTKASNATKSLVINDLQAQGFAVNALNQTMITSILKGNDTRPQATRLVVGLGTGFNAVPVYCQNGIPFVPPSETGHADLPVRSEVERELAQYIAEDGNSATLEDLLSGKGLAGAYGYFSAIPKGAALPDPAWVIEAAKSGSDANAGIALNTFIRLLGRSIADLALIHLPFGGIFLVGGVARAVAPFLGDRGFQEAFRDKGRFSPFMENFSISLINSDFSALHGCVLAAELARSK